LVGRERDRELLCGLLLNRFKVLSKVQYKKIIRRGNIEILNREHQIDETAAHTHVTEA
jgi:hypothetical protein